MAKQVNNSGFTPLDNYFSKMGELVSERKTSARVRFHIQVPIFMKKR